MGKMKVVVSVLSGLLATGVMVSPALAASSTQPIHVSQFQYGNSSIPNFSITQSELAVLKEVKVTVKGDHLTVIPSGKVSDPKTFALIERGIRVLNRSIDQGYANIVDGKLVLTQKARASTASSGRISSNATLTSSGWWGANVYLDQQQTAYEISALNTTGAIWGFVALVSGIVGLALPPAWVVTLCAGITSLGAFVMANNMSAADWAGDGVTVELRWWGVYCKTGYVVS